VTSGWTARYPDLTGKTVIVAGESDRVIEISAALAANGAMLAIVSADRTAVDSAVRRAEADEVSVLGLTADPADPGVWPRIAPQIEQRLGPIDVVVTVGTAAMRDVVVHAVQPDMAARGRGVLVEVDASAPPRDLPVGLRHRGIEAPGRRAAADVAAAVLICASDTVTAEKMTVRLAPSADCP
jgi:hypothetical protein